MTRDVRVARPAEHRCAAVANEERLMGMVTDRDLVVRALARCKGPSTRVREVMSAEVRYCYDDEDLAHVAENMAQLRVRRLPVVDRDKRLVGIISRPGGPHSQTTRA